MNITAEEVYKSLSEEFVRKGVASNRFSELNELFTWAQIGEEAKSEQSQLAKKDQIIAELKRLYFYGDKGNWDNNLGYAYTTIVNDYGDDVAGTCKGVVIGGKLAREIAERVKKLEEGV